MLTTNFQINGNERHRRGARVRSRALNNNTVNLGHSSSKVRTIRQLPKKRLVQKHRRHHHGEEHILKLNLHQTKHKMRIIKLQPAIKVTQTDFLWYSTAFNFSPSYLVFFLFFQTYIHTHWHLLAGRKNGIYHRKREQEKSFRSREGTRNLCFALSYSSKTRGRISHCHTRPASQWYHGGKRSLGETFDI